VGKGSEVETEFQITYEPQSSSNQIDTLVPRHQVGAVQQALSRVVEEHGSLDNFVAHELGYDDLTPYFSAEQIDALALMIANHKQGRAFRPEALLHFRGPQSGYPEAAKAALLRREWNANSKRLRVCVRPTLPGRPQSFVDQCGPRTLFSVLVLVVGTLSAVRGPHMHFICSAEQA
jgi:hypothetical protein